MNIKKNVYIILFFYRYRGMDDDDDECMESDFRTLQKEEYRSARAGKYNFILFYYIL